MPTAILLVDDDPSARRAIERLIATEPRLRALEPQVVQALDGHRGLVALETERPDLVITELSIPGMDGFAFCREIRRSPDRHDLPILVMSGVYKDPTVIGDLLKELRAAFIPKPVEASVLADALLSALPGGGGPRASEAEDLGLSSDVLLAVSPSTLAALKGQPPDQTGSLAERGVAKLLFDHIEAASTGTLVLVRGQMRKEIFLREGRVVAADSNLREEALGSLLCSKRVIDDQQLQFLLAETKKRGQKMGAVLVELGWMSAEDVLLYLAAQARKRVVDCLRWPEGSWSFTRGDTFSDRVTEHELDMPKIIFSGLYRTAKPEELASRFDEDGARPPRLLPRFAPFQASFTAVFGNEILPLIAEGATFGSLVLRDDGQMLALALEALLSSGLADLDPAPPETEEAPRDSAQVFTLERLGSEASGRVRAVPEAPAESADPTRPEFAAFDPAAWAAEPVAPLSAADSGKVELFASPGSQTAIPVLEGKPDLRSQLLREYLELQGKSLYDVLGVKLKAGAEEIARAYVSKIDRISEKALEGISLGNDAPKIEALRAAYDRAFRSLSDPTARKGYDDDRESQPAMPALDNLGAELAFGEGMTLLDAGKTPEAIERFRHAVGARPDQAAYHAYLGWALFVAGGVAELEVARGRLSHALALDPDLPKAHEFLGRLALDQGDTATARRHLERALDKDPAQPLLVELLVRIYGRLDDARGAEKVYRRLIGALGEGSAALRAQLWRVLGELYETRLRDRENARTAYEAAARLAPSDITAQRKVIELNAQDPARWRESARALAAEWQQSPKDAELGRRLVNIFLKAGRLDAATVTASALVLRDLADDDGKKLAEQGRPRLLRRLAAPLEQSVMRRIAAPGEEEEVEAMMDALARARVLEPIRLEDLGAGAPLVPDQMPAAFRRVLGYACEVLRIEEAPAVVPDTRLHGGARVIDVRPHALLVGSALLESTDTVELGFRLSRALACGTPGRVAGSVRTGRHLRPYFVAALTLARGASNSPDPDVQPVLARVLAAAPALRTSLAGIGARLLRSRREVNLSDWARSLGRTANRVGLLLSSDLVRAGRAVAEEDGAEALDDLISFALSPEHLDLREELGLSTIV
jgi:CheY-like chemotaxis protein/tetratricopeptide (TPR) repeat protein